MHSFILGNNSVLMTGTVSSKNNAHLTPEFWSNIPETIYLYCMSCQGGCLAEIIKFVYPAPFTHASLLIVLNANMQGIYQDHF